MKISELLSDESKWCKGDYARDAQGMPINHLSSDARSWCLLGAAYRCYYSDEAVRVISKMSEALRASGMDGGWGEISEFNDDPDTDFKTIRKFLVELDL